MLIISSQTLALGSDNRINDFKFAQCSTNACMQASGPIAYVGSTLDTISAPSVRLELKRNSGKKETFQCDSFRFTLRTGFLICDNQAVKQASFTVNADLEVHKYD